MTRCDRVRSTNLAQDISQACADEDTLSVEPVAKLQLYHI